MCFNSLCSVDFEDCIKEILDLQKCYCNFEQYIISI